METFYERLLKESSELGEKVEKLYKFINSENFLQLELIHQELLKLQYNTMCQYIDILDMRVRLLD